MNAYAHLYEPIDGSLESKQRIALVKATEAAIPHLSLDDRALTGMS
jgi:hypothetical protein